MKVTFVCDSGANIHSAREAEFDTEIDFGYTDEEWQALTEDQIYEMVSEWAHDRLKIYYIEGSDMIYRVYNDFDNRYFFKRENAIKFLENRAYPNLWTFEVIEMGDYYE